MDGGEEGGEPGEGDVVGKKVEFGDVVPDFGFGGELVFVSLVLLLLLLLLLLIYVTDHGDDEDFGRDLIVLSV